MIQAIRRHQARRRDTQSGFTLIELLVVIIVLGILAAVVVFAVSGVGDKGKASAYAIDARTIRTAEEAFCAQFGRYGDAQELVTGGFLSEAPTYHQVDTAPADTPGSGCTGAGDPSRASYVIVCDEGTEGCGGGGALKVGWRQKDTGAGNVDLHDVVFVNSTTGWVVGDGGTIRKTADGGDSWASQASGTTERLRDVEFVDASNGWIVGEDITIRRTVDGGATWTPQALPDPGPYAGFSLLGVDFNNPSEGWLVGTCGLVAKTTNGGADWALVVDPYVLDPGLACNEGEFYTVQFLNSSIGWVGADPNAVDSTNLWKTTDGGTTWQKLQTDTFCTCTSLRSFSFLSPTLGWSAGYSGMSHIHKTADGGATWTPQVQLNGNREAIEMVNPLVGWSAGVPNNGVGGVVKTTDGGLTWVNANPPSLPFRGLGLDFLSVGRGWVSGLQGKILKWGPVP